MVGDGELRQELQAMVSDSLRHRVIWLGHVADMSKVNTIVKCCDLLLHTCVLEAWGQVIQEAAVAGLPMIVTNNAGAAVDLVQDGVNGRTVPPKDVEACTAALLEVTDQAKYEMYKANTSSTLTSWRQKFDRAEGLRRALASANVQLGEAPIRA